MIMASNVIDDRDKSFISKFRDYFIEENDADSAGISPAEVTRSNGGSGITQMLIDHITSKRPVPPTLRCN